ncbi:helix-turn-helix transcriptional regulator [Flexithrix dorotheae]|uniref:helix-turn-helix transcriptional regulator n=1 Tax=Flexithrix dorotheae TaxID=70993 RepID=UPI000374343E|nr:YafY family protein [Flexithrix dorotheae]
MNRIDRLSAILIQLQSKRIVTAREIAERFEISLRTVYRDIRALESGGVPIASEAGVGYSLVPGYHLPPVMFTDKEAGAILLGSKLLEQFADKAIKTEFESALYKIQAVLKSSGKEHLENLNEKIKVMGFYGPPPQESGFLLNIQEALSKHREISIEYLSNKKNELTSRIIEPIGLCHYGSGWHLIAFCQLRNGYRDFRTNRIKQLEILDKKVAKDNHPNLSEYFDSLQEALDFREIVLKVNSATRRIMEDQVYYMGLVNEKENKNDVQLHFMINNLNAFARWIIMYGKSIEILRPEFLKKEVKKLVNELLKHYS